MSAMEAIQEKIRNNNYIITSEDILGLIAEHDTKQMKEGVRYYLSESDILNRQRYFYNKLRQRVVDPTKENIRLVNNWHKLLVDQKISYLIGKPMVFTVDENKNYDNSKLYDKLDNILGEEWDDMIADIGTNASNKGTEWLHCYIDVSGEFCYCIAPAEEIIPVYKSTKKKQLDGVLRYYNVFIDGKAYIKVEWWTSETVTIFIENDNGDFIIDTNELQNPLPHYSKKNKLHQKQGKGWNKVPFIEFPNNSFRINDLATVRTLIDEYDKGISDFANVNAEVQELITVLKGYENTDLSEFKENLAYFKAIKIRGDGNSGVDVLKSAIPVEAKTELLNRLEEAIFMFGQGVNVKTDRFGNSPSGESLDFLYNSLKLKATMMERKFRRSIQQFLWFVVEYINLENKSKYNSNDIKVEFRINMTRNNKEIIESLTKSRDLISDETIVSLYPLIENSSYEYTKLKQQREDRLKESTQAYE